MKLSVMALLISFSSLILIACGPPPPPPLKPLILEGTPSAATGIKNIRIGDTDWDVTFHEGSYDSLYSYTPPVDDHEATQKIFDAFNKLNVTGLSSDKGTCGLENINEVYRCHVVVPREIVLTQMQGSSVDLTKSGWDTKKYHLMLRDKDTTNEVFYVFYAKFK